VSKVGVEKKRDKVEKNRNHQELTSVHVEVDADGRRGRLLPAGRRGGSPVREHGGSLAARGRRDAGNSGCEINDGFHFEVGVSVWLEGGKVSHDKILRS